MADNIELVIKIPEKLYKHIMSMQFYIPGSRNGKSLLEEILKAIRTATPLSKGHGKLIDADELKKEYPHDTDWEYPVNTNSYVVESINNMTTIIEADKEE